MAKIVEPPILISRILVFMLATSGVVLVVLLYSLSKMVPLERPEVFFLMSSTRSVNAVIEPLIPDESDKKAIENYEKGFVREYVIARNTLYPNATLTRRNWANVVKPWSSDAVYKAFTQTALYSDYVDYSIEDMPPILSCEVNFTTQDGEVPVFPGPKNQNTSEYTVNFVWVCKNNSGHSTQKKYRIRIKVKSILEKELRATARNLDKMRSNPLGTLVTEYTVLIGDEDPLDSNANSL